MLQCPLLGVVVISWVVGNKKYPQEGSKTPSSSSSSSALNGQRTWAIDWNMLKLEKRNKKSRRSKLLHWVAWWLLGTECMWQFSCGRPEFRPFRQQRWFHITIRFGLIVLHLYAWCVCCLAAVLVNVFCYHLSHLKYDSWLQLVNHEHFLQHLTQTNNRSQ